MINSRQIDDLLLPVRLLCVDHLSLCRKAGIDVILTSTYRDAESQDELYAIGRTKPGRVVTNARGGDSFHNYHIAYDLLPLRHGKPVWGTTGNGIDNDPYDDATDDLELWERIGVLGEQAGLEWAGRWVKFREFPHFQYTHGLSLADFKAGKTIPQDIRRSA